MSLRVIDLFSGGGGMSLGFEDPRFCGGHEVFLSIDNDAAAVATHGVNFEGDAVCANIEQWLVENDVPEADVVIGGPPCQGFSLLNKKRIGDQRRALWEPFIEIANLSGARVFVMENVAELLRSPELGEIKAKAREYGFFTDACILNAADYGTPQTRKRAIVLGWRGIFNAPQFPPLPTHAAPGSEGNLPLWKTVKGAIADLPPPSETEIQGKAPLDIHIKRNPTEKSKRRYKAVPPGGNRFDLQKNAPEITPQCWINKKSGSTDLFGRLWWDRPSVTIRTEFFKPEKGRYLHPDQHRPITHREAARLMGFPDDFKFVGTKIQIAKQIGNAVPPPLAGNLGRLVIEMLTPLRNTA
jgi:DNA (cytosine-5)-methyltransferase 1